MLISDMTTVGNNLYSARKARGYTQAELAEKAGLSDRTYADIERGSVNMRVDTLIKICKALHITPDDILVADGGAEITEEELTEVLRECSAQEKKTALRLLSVYVDSLK